MTCGTDVVDGDFTLSVVARSACTILVACDMAPTWLSDTIGFARSGQERHKILHARSDTTLTAFSLYQKELQEGEALTLKESTGSRYMYAVFVRRKTTMDMCQQGPKKRRTSTSAPRKRRRPYTC